MTITKFAHLKNSNRFYVLNLKMMFSNYYGEWAALLVAVFWTITAIAFESASKKIGSLTVNLLRLPLL